MVALLASELRTEVGLAWLGLGLGLGLRIGLGLYLPYISPTSPLYLPRISPVSPLDRTHGGGELGEEHERGVAHAPVLILAEPADLVRGRGRVRPDISLLSRRDLPWIAPGSHQADDAVALLPPLVGDAHHLDEGVQLAWLGVGAGGFGVGGL